MIADTLTQLRDRVLNERLHPPAAGAAAHIVEEIPENLAAVRRVADFRMELQPINGSRAMANRGDRARVRGGQREEVLAHRVDLIAVAHPGNRFAGNAGEQAVGFLNADMRTSKLAAARRLHLAAERLAGELHAVADAEHGNAEVEDRRVELRRPRLVDAGRSTGENKAAWCQLADTRRRYVVTHDLAKDILLAHAPSDELAVLRAEVDDENTLVRRRRHEGFPNSIDRKSVV